jgi:cytochrome c oxidase cbb3-type subunit I/II
MFSAFTPEGQLQYQFMDVVQSIAPFYLLRAIGGTLFLAGVIIMIYNLIKTAKNGQFITEESAQAAPLHKDIPAAKSIYKHDVIERKPILLLVMSLIVVGIGGLVELVPTFLIKSNVPTISSVKPYTPLELQGRDIYIREGCYNCHSQMIRPFRHEVMRYGDYSKSGEFVYDHPFQWGSKRTGPDLARIGGKYPDSWHFNHMLDPESISPGTNMPKYPWLFQKDIAFSSTYSKIHAMRKIGVPYPNGYESKANDDLKKQALIITKKLKGDKIDISPDKEIIALIAYLQRLGKDTRAKSTTKN